MFEKIQQLFSKKSEYDEQSQYLIDTYLQTLKDMEGIDEMKRTEGWQTIERKIREELRNRIEILVKDDPKIQTLLGILNVTSTKKVREELKSEIDKWLPT